MDVPSGFWLQEILAFRSTWEVQGLNSVRQLFSFYGCNLGSLNFFKHWSHAKVDWNLISATSHRDGCDRLVRLVVMCFRLYIYTSESLQWVYPPVVLAMGIHHTWIVRWFSHIFPNEHHLVMQRGNSQFIYQWSVKEVWMGDLPKMFHLTENHHWFHQSQYPGGALMESTTTSWFISPTNWNKLRETDVTIDVREWWTVGVLLSLLRRRYLLECYVY
jgi:hypothetical protein